MTGKDDTLVRLIWLSIWASVVWGVGALIVGLALGSQTILFDGLYSLLTMLLSVLSLAAARAVRRGPSAQYPYGRQAFGPMANIVRAVGLFGLVLYAISAATLDIMAGGNQINYGWALGYAVVVMVGSGVLTLHLRRRQRSVGSGLLEGEVSKWRMDTSTSFGVVVGFGIGLLLQRGGHDQAAAYADPVIVIVFALSSLVAPLRLGIQAFRAVADASAPPETVEEVRRRVRGLERRHGFVESFARVGQNGEQLDIEVYFVVGDGTTAREVGAFDEIRGELERSLDDLDQERWLTVSFTADRGFALHPWEE